MCAQTFLCSGGQPGTEVLVAAVILQPHSPRPLRKTRQQPQCLQRVLQCWKGRAAAEVPWSSGYNTAWPQAHLSSTGSFVCSILYVCTSKCTERGGVWNRLTKQSLIMTDTEVCLHKRKEHSKTMQIPCDNSDWWAGSPGLGTAQQPTYRQVIKQTPGLTHLSMQRAAPSQKTALREKARSATRNLLFTNSSQASKQQT